MSSQIKGKIRVVLYSQNLFKGLALCAGVGGLELGIRIAEPNYQTVCFVEREAFPAATLVARMEDKALDDAPIWDDVATFDGCPWREKVSVVTGGYPCQPFSQCGKKLGENDPRHIWPHVRRIVREISPEWCFFENVEGHITLGADAVIDDLQTMGYTVKAGLFSALECGASHIRRRLFIMAHADSFELSHQHRICAGKRWPQNTSRCDEGWKAIQYNRNCEALDNDLDVDNHLRSQTDRPLSLPIFAPPPSDFEAWGEILAKRPDLQPSFFGLDNGLADGMERSAAAGNGVVSLVAAYAWRTLKAAHSE